MDREVVLSGIRATGRLHLGNYLGAVKQFAELSHDPTKLCIYFVADLHTLTTLKEAQKIKEYLPEIILDYVAAGVDPETSIIFAQSSVPETTQLAWILSCITPLGDLFRIPTFKDKVASVQKQSPLKSLRVSPGEQESKESYAGVNAGLLNYPVLMAADILGVKAHIVPVGDDQRPHLEMTAELARRFNREVAKREVFPIPVGKTTTVIPGLSPMNSDGSFSKMGKSEGNTVNLFDPPSAIKAKIRSAPTDPARVRRSDPGTPTLCPIFALHSCVSPDTEVQYCANGCTQATIGCTECKDILAKNISEILVPFQERRDSFASQPFLVRDVLAAGTVKARRIIAETVQEVSQSIGLTYNLTSL